MAKQTYLDTHIIVWLYSGDLDNLSKKARKSIEASDLFYSPVVRLELTYLKEIGKIKVKADKILSYLKKTIDLKISEITFEKVIENSIDINWTRDPFDRIIVAQALVNSSSLITKDITIRKKYKYCIW